jgi:DNA invertase Pin-like site-specific DNA recombinase
MSKARTRRAFSYVRFSTVQQAGGGSLQRQTELSQAYCKRKGLALDDSLTLRDLGVSAFRGDNVRDGALAGFLEACRTGRVPKGSVLIVESLDRLSRDQIRPALQLFLALQDHGVTIVTLQPEREYPPDGTDALALMEPLIVFARAHEESAMKSHRRRDGWRQARDKARKGGGPIMKTCPAWLEVTLEGFRVKEEAAATVGRIFELALDGLGVYRITETLNREGVPRLGTGSRWVVPYVYRILTNPAAMGTYQPNRQEGKKVVPDGPPIPGHYPAVVSAEVWRQARQAIESRAGGFKRGGKGSPAAGRKGAQETNLFGRLLRCARTGEKLHIVNALGNQTAGERKRYRYLCAAQDSGTAGGSRLDYSVFEAAVLSLLRELRPADIAAEGKPGNGRQAEIARLCGRLVDLDSRLERAKQRARDAEDFDAFLDLIQELQGERKQVGDRLAGLRQEEEGESAGDLGEAQSLIAMLARAGAEELPDLRRRLKARIRLLVAEAWVVIVPRGRDRLAAVQLLFRGGRRRDYLILHRPGKSYGKARVDGQWWALSLSAAVRAGDLDLREPEQADALAEVLAAADLARLAAKMAE